MLYWLSFCDKKRPDGSQFLGVAIVEAEDAEGAIVEAHRRGINPGGEVASHPIPSQEGQRMARPYRNRLLQLDEAGRVFGPIVRRVVDGVALAPARRNEELKT